MVLLIAAMNRLRAIAVVLAALSFAAVCGASASDTRPRTVLTAGDVSLMRESLGKYPLFDALVEQTKNDIGAALAAPMDVPVPKDAGGYTHERHKKNYVEMQKAGVLFQLTGDVRYAKFVRDMLLKYADLYPTLPLHPMAGGESVGRLFWQTLNETVWLINSSQAYDCVYEFLTPAEREKIERGVLRRLAESFIKDHTEEHDRIHNHGTWMVASVGMLGYALHDTGMVTMALYGTKKDGSGGFLRQIDSLFSPDGYYSEGAYYVRYAIFPFIVFAQAIENNQPELKIWDRRGGILRKAVYAALQQTYTDGKFLPFNDALKDMDFTSGEMVTALDVVYRQFGGDNSLLGVAQRQNTVMLSGAGVAVARGLATVSPVPQFEWKSVEYTDGGHGNKGGIGILRSGPPSDQSLVFLKYPGQGMGHGHFDKLNWMYYNQGRELVQDYGAARFINIEPKNGGRYLPENNTWAKQTIAHNTVTVDERSQYNGNAKLAEEHHGERHFFNITDPNFQVVSAKVDGAYPGVAMQRTMALIKDPKFPEPVVIDLFRLVSDSVHQYDLPWYYQGQFIAANIKYKAYDRERAQMGAKNGYQFLWKEAEGTPDGPFRFTWLAGHRYYSVVTAADSTDRVFFARIGANDPNFNLRNEPAMILRVKGSSRVFASVLEPHGYFEPVSERSDNAAGIITSIRVVASDNEGTVAEIQGRNGLKWIFLVANGPASDSAKHQINVGGRTYSWTGNAALQQ